jgi:hypothetical protein
MVDFLRIATRSTKRGSIEVYPKFIVGKSSDLMIKGGDFYAVWLEDRKLWSTDEQDVINLVDAELDNYAKENKNHFDGNINVLHMWDAESGSIDFWHKYCQKQMRDNFHILDEKLIFSNQDTKKEDYASKRLNYPLEEGKTTAYDELISVLYSKEERHKIEWCIGAIVTGASRDLQKFLVFYGASGTGKSTVIDIIQQLFDGYCSTFDAKALGSSTDNFALECLKSNPLVAIQYDGDLSRIEDNTRLNSLISHETMTVNEKHKSIYSTRFNSFLIMGTNKPVKITDGKSGIIRRLIDVRPTGDRLPLDKYEQLVHKIGKELGHIAWHCKGVYEENPEYYENYTPTLMMGESNDFYNFVLDSYTVFKKDDGVSLKAAWEMYKTYCDEAKVQFPYPMRMFKSELKNYFKKYDERVRKDDDIVRSYYSVFKTDIFAQERVYDDSDTVKDTEVKTQEKKNVTTEEDPNLIKFKIQPSNFDKTCKDYPAQYANEDGTPLKKWENVTTTLKTLDTTRLHYVKVPENHIVIDFDIKGEDGEKDYNKNLIEASKWPKTYAELSKSGCGIHLHYIYDGDVTKLNRLYSEDIEIKVFTGNSSLRRKLTKCNNETINHLSDILPKRKEKKAMLDFDSVKNEKALRTIIRKNLNKEYHPATKPSIDFINKALEDAYNSGMKYDVSDMFDAIFAFAAGSTHQAEYCIKLVSQMHLKSDDPSDSKDSETPIIIMDSEVFPNLYLVNYKELGKDKKIVRLINPTPEQIENILKYRIVGFNNRRYDNHIMYARLIGKSNQELYEQSHQIIVSKSKVNGGLFQEAYNLSYTDIYDYASNKQSLKKWEIELGIHHQELPYSFDKPVPKEKWQEVSEYCDNDVLSTEAVWYATQEDFIAREILVAAANKLCPSIKSTVNDTTNMLTARIIFRGDRHPQSQFIYTNLATGERSDGKIDSHNFPGYKYENGVSTYLGEEIGEGGYVWAKPGMYENVTTFDVASMHPHSAIALEAFGPTYTKNFKEVVDTRVLVKHSDWETATKMLMGALASYITKDMPADVGKKLAYALKIAINAVYGQTAAHFDNAFRDPRNFDNIVAKRGALFMCQLKHEVQAMGGEVVHIKTDSIKVSNPSDKVVSYIIARGKEYGYDFEVESVYERFCLINDAVYIAKCAKDDRNGKEAGQWTATGAQFQVPYVFKKCFSHEEVVPRDLCEAKEVKTVMYLNMNENLPEGQYALKFIGKVGLFTPIKKGCGGGELVKESTKKDGSIGYDAVTGTKGYRWLESEEVFSEHLESNIDMAYYQELVNDAIDTISTYGDYEYFTRQDEEDILPF